MVELQIAWVLSVKKSDTFTDTINVLDTCKGTWSRGNFLKTLGGEHQV